MPPTVVLVPGMFSVGSVFYKPLEKDLRNKGFTDVVTIDLPSVDSISRAKELVPNPLEADIKYLREQAEALVEIGQDVLLVAHSYGGTIALYACEGLWKHERESSGKTGGVMKAALLSSSLSLPGTKIGAVRGEWAAKHMPDMIVGSETSRVEVFEGLPFVYPDGGKELFFSDMTPEDQEYWASTGLRPHPIGSVMSDAPQAKISSWRIAYLITAEDDLSMPEAFQQYLVDNAKENGALIEEVKTIKSGHFVQITHAEEVAAWLREISFT